MSSTDAEAVRADLLKWLQETAAVVGKADLLYVSVDTITDLVTGKNTALLRVDFKMPERK